MVSDVTEMSFDSGKIILVTLGMIRSIGKRYLGPSMLTLIHECRIR